MLTPSLLGSVLEWAPDAIVVIDEEGRMVFSNRQMLLLFGHSAQTLRGANIEMLLPLRFRDGHKQHRQRYAATGGRVRPMGSGMELYGLRADSSEFPIEISLSPIHDGGRLLVAAAIRDVSARIAVEKQLQEARKAADRANAAKSRFLATASHDLRQPLQSLGLLNGSLQRLVTDEAAQQVLAQQAQSISSMGRLLNTLLDISKLESGAIRPELRNFALDGLLTELQREFGPLAEARGLALRIEISVEQVHSDPALLGQILRNLLSNAVKFTPAGQVMLRCETDADSVRVEVIDTGVGIAPEHLSEICDEFYQVGIEAQQSREGYGLGLSIVKRLASLLHTRLDIRSTPGAGSTFSIRLPRVRHRRTLLPDVTAPSPAPPIATGAPLAGTGQRVLLVEDDASVRDATRLLLKISGYVVKAVTNAAEAVDSAAREGMPDLLITDYHLGREGTGVELLHTLRRTAPALPAILVSGDTSQAMREIVRLDALQLLSKPIDANALLSAVCDLLQSSGYAKA
jgi:PAS domain S-box-containing protein